MKHIRRSGLVSVWICGLILVSAISAYGDTGRIDPQEALLPVDSPAAEEAIAVIVALAGDVSGEHSEWLLPPGTVLDTVQWDNHVAGIALTVPEWADDWRLSDKDVETLSYMLETPFRGDAAFGGTRIYVRLARAGVYGTLADFMPQVTGTDAGEQPGEIPSALHGTPPARTPRGPVAQAGRQPVGALTGVTVFTSAGHGWTADNIVENPPDPTDLKWFLQRPVLLDMCEDYGNIDILNLFVHYAFNAGATVVPMRPVGWQPLEIVLDNDDPGVTYTGVWDDGTSSKYYENGVTPSGVVYKWISADTVETHIARYTPTITVTDYYPVYCFTVAGANRTYQTYRVGHSGGETEITIDHREVGSGWIWLGDYYLEAGGDNYVEITNLSAEAGAIIADAIRWGGGLGDITRPGPGTISGYPRDQECQRYWAESEWGNNAVGFSSDIWNPSSSDDYSDNVGTGARIGREMNQVPAGGVEVERWKRIHLEFHTNASTGDARGQICLITTLGETTYQEEYAIMLSNEVDNDMFYMASEFEHSWVDRASPTYTSAYGAIATTNNDNEFDATIVELAFHDNQEDAELLRDSRVRAAMARSCVHGIIRFLNTLPDSEVPLAFAPDTPRAVRAEDLGGGEVCIAWQAPLSGPARGDPATGYVVYQSANGYGFGDPIVLGDVLTTTISGVPVGETRYFRIAATNAGGESMPSEVIAVRRPSTGTVRVLVVNGFDRLRRQINPIQEFTQPADYAGLWIERQMWRRSNSYDYVVQHAEALAAAGYGFASCANEAVSDSYVQMGDYAIALWILGTESAEDATFSSGERNRVTDFLLDGGALFVSGAEIGYDLIDQGNGVSFAQDTLRIDYVADDADTFDVTGAAGSILSDIGPFDFDPANGAPYEVYAPDELAAGSGSMACLNYVGGTGGVAGVQHTGMVYNVVTFGFPFETITSPTVRADIMQRVMAFLETAAGPRPFDYDRNGYVELLDLNYFMWCFAGPDTSYPEGHLCVDVVGEEDLDIDLEDLVLFQQVYTGPPAP
ncbi:MAG: hypothetical protein ABIG44_09020 [Planctomycetota bacterium]